MKTAISLDEALFREADAVARELGTSRSQLVATALAQFLKRRRDEEITRRMNEIYAEPPDEDEQRQLDAALRIHLRWLRDNDPW